VVVVVVVVRSEPRALWFGVLGVTVRCARLVLCLGLGVARVISNDDKRGAVARYNISENFFFLADAWKMDYGGHDSHITGNVVYHSASNDGQVTTREARPHRLRMEHSATEERAGRRRWRPPTRQKDASFPVSI
jgi:hypothetical protein